MAASARTSARSPRRTHGRGAVGVDARPAAGPLIAVEIYPAPLIQAAWRAQPALRGAPLAVAPIGSGGRVVCACPLAASVGVADGQSVAQARLRCPTLVVVPPDPVAAALLYDEMLHALVVFSPLVEAADADAGVAYLDAHGLAALWGADPARWDGGVVARGLVDALAARGLAVRAGAGPTRVVARALARRMDAGGPRALGADATTAFLRALPLADPALGLTPAAVAALRDLGITTAGALAALPDAGVSLRFGDDVRAAWRIASGTGESPLRRWTPPARLTVTRTLDGGVLDGVVLAATARELGERLAGLLARQGHAAAALTLQLTCEDGARHARRGQQWPPIQGAPALVSGALALLAGVRPLTAVETVELCTTDLRAPDATQHGLWDDEGAHVGRRQSRLSAVLAAHTPRDGLGLAYRWRADPLADEGWTRDAVDPGP